MTQTVDRGTRVADLAAAADRIRHHILNMGEVQGQGYVGQGLGFADVLAVIYKDLTTYHPEDPHWEGRDRVLLSMGHYAIAAGAVDTDIRSAGTTPELEASIVAGTPLGRQASVDDVTALFAFLASEEAGYITATTQNLNGGSYIA